VLRDRFFLLVIVCVQAHPAHLPACIAQSIDKEQGCFQDKPAGS